MPEIKGVDVSKWQGDIQWDKVKGAGIEFVMIRVGYSTNLDKNFYKNIDNAIKNGIKCGVYLYSYARTADEARAEAQFVINTIKPYKITYPVSYDIEDKTQHDLTNEQRTDMVDAFCSTIEAAGYYATVYTSLYWFNTMFDMDRLKKYDKWVAQWGDKCTFNDKFGMWQYSSKGKIDGITGDVDLNISYVAYDTINVPANPQNSTVVKPPVAVPPVVAPPAQSKPEIKKFEAGYKFNATGIPIYSTSVSSRVSASITGSYWIYDGINTNGRYRITNSQSSVKQTPIGKFVTGYVNAKQIG